VDIPLASMSAKIYSKNGDGGLSSIAKGGPLPKSSTIFDLLGDLDELNSWFGLLKLEQIQADLFLLGAIFSGALPYQRDVFSKRVQEIEYQIDKLSEQLPPLTNFILPGGTTDSAHIFITRAVCRRVERALIKTLSSSERLLYSEISRYLNRLSDYLFVLARYVLSQAGCSEIVWRH